MSQEQENLDNLYQEPKLAIGIYFSSSLSESVQSSWVRQFVHSWDPNLVTTNQEVDYLASICLKLNMIFREIDPAMLRRLEKRINIPLPDSKTRVELFEKFLISKTLELAPKVDFKELAAKTEGYSGSDIKLVCKEALMCTVRKILPNMVGRSKLFVNCLHVLQSCHKKPKVS